MRTQWLIISALVFSLITAIFAVINVNSVEVNFLFGKASMPLILVILAATLLGGVTVGLFGIIRQYRMQRRIRQLEKQLAELESAGAGALPRRRAADPAREAGQPAAEEAAGSATFTGKGPL